MFFVLLHVWYTIACFACLVWWLLCVRVAGVVLVGVCVVSISLLVLLRGCSSVHVRLCICC